MKYSKKKNNDINIFKFSKKKKFSNKKSKSSKSSKNFKLSNKNIFINNDIYRDYSIKDIKNII